MGDHRRRPDPTMVGLPIRPFFFTIDQIGTMVQITEDRLKRDYLHYEGRSLGPRPTDKMLARNIAPEGIKPDWRVTEQEVIRWMRNRGFRVYDRGWPIL